MNYSSVTIRFGAVLAVGALCLAGCGSGSTGLAVGSKAPDFSLEDLSGSEVSLKVADERQPVTVLVFWATWCPACRDEIPALRKFYADYSERGVRVLSISVDRGGNGVDSFGRKNEINYPVLLDKDSSVALKYGVRGIPNLLVVDSSLVVRYNGHSVRGAQKAVDDLS